jgi:hypothetical protein
MDGLTGLGRVAGSAQVQNRPFGAFAGGLGDVRPVFAVDSSRGRSARKSNVARSSLQQ